ncbi:hypothetical protein UB32_00605 [Mesobacillus subterraneus]|uniref:DarT domain-containing protein n=2 Tax=Mesobacillus TaxID=2675231 RepID=A0A0D6ZFL2_9BACI|nr:hypothetical protein UB32_00605 [Mesobacillus subterraneus]MDQ0415490.1 phage terminase large subunit-like protein [Mesobacillus stamsii]
MKDDDDWTNEKTWYKANPSLDHTIDIEKVRNAFISARENPAEENIFRQLRYTKNVKMAECLTPLIVPAKLFHCIYVKNEETRSLVREKLQSKEITKTPPFVDVGYWL